MISINGITRWKNWTYEVIECGTGWPVSLTAVKRHLKLDVDDTENDDYLTFLIKASAEHVERVSHRDLINKKYRTFRQCFPPYLDTRGREEGIQLRRSKLQSVDLFEYLVDDVFTTVSSSVFYTTDEKDYSSIFLKDGQNWPSNLDNHKQAIKIEFTAGFGENEEDIPEDLRLVLLHMIANMYDNRGDCTTDNCGACVFGGAGSLLAKWTIKEIGV